MSSDTLEQIRQILQAAEIEFKEVEHAPTHTSEESAQARGEPLGVGAKALVLRTNDTFRLFVLPADRKLDWAAVKRKFEVKKVRFATPEELLELTGLVPGSVPPFGAPILPIELFADESLGMQYGRIAFNAGSLTHSIVMQAADWESVSNPQRFSFTKD